MGLTAIDHVQRLLDNARTLVIPNTPRRRSGSDSAFTTAASYTHRSMEEIHRHAIEVDGSNTEELRQARVELTLEIASILFSAGAPHPEWRWWARQAAQALREYDELPSAAIWGVLAHDDELVTGLPQCPEPQGDPSLIVWWLAVNKGGPPAARSRVPRDHVDRAWVDLSQSIPAKDHATTGQALRTVADFWMGEDEDWKSFHPGYYPDFEPDVNAVAVLAQKVGWRPVDWPPDALRFLEPGLANGEAS